MAVDLGSVAKAASGLAPGKGAGKTDLGLFYVIRPGNWYKTYPFYFEIRDTKTDTLAMRFYLPIPPQNLTIQDMSTSEAHATIGGVVEETSNGVFNMITLVGTTGLSSKALDLGTTGKDPDQLVVSFRKYVDDLTGRTNPLTKLIGGATDAVLNGVSGILGEAEARLPYQDAGSAVDSSNAGLDSVVSTLSIGGKTGQKTAGGLSGFLSGQASAVAGLFTNDKKDYTTPFANGYSWSHALRQFFLIYQREKGLNADLGLYFFDIKAGTQYRCVVRSAQFTQNAQNPYMINYNLSLKGWEIKSSVADFKKAEINRFGPDGDLKEVYTANITASITKIANTIKTFRRPSSVAGALIKNSTSSVI